MRTGRCDRPTGLYGVLISAVVAGSLVVGPVVARGVEAQPGVAVENASAVIAPEPVPGSYCGVHSLLLAARSLGKEVTLVDLLKPEYIGSKKGSSLGELTRAAGELGLFAAPMRRMTCAMLRGAECPMILRVKWDVKTRDYEHWVLFMGTDDGKARIYDGTRLLMGRADIFSLVEFEELAALWDGTALIVSDRPIPRWPLVMDALLPCLGFANLALLGVALLHPAQRRWLTVASTSRRRWFAGVVIEALAITAFAMGAAMAYRTAHKDGFLTHRPAVAAIQDAHLASFLPQVKVREMAELAARAREVLIVDARPAKDYAASHIPGAINIPYDSKPKQLTQTLSIVPRDGRIVVYCHSSGCPYSESLARTLLACGFTRIAIFRGGWVEWQKSLEAPPFMTGVLRERTGVYVRSL